MHSINQDIKCEDQAPISKAIAAKRLKLDEAGKKACLEKAKLKLRKDPASRNVTLGKNCKVRPADRVYMQEAFSKDGVFSDLKLFIGKFPGIFTINDSIIRNMCVM